MACWIGWLQRWQLTSVTVLCMRHQWLCDIQPQSSVDVTYLLSLLIAAVFAFMWLHQSLQLNPKLWPLLQQGSLDLFMPSRTSGLICWSQASIVFTHSDLHFRMCCTKHGPVVSYLGLNRLAWPPASLVNNYIFFFISCLRYLFRT